MKNSIYPELIIEDLSIKEYAADSTYEEYTGIVLDPEDRVFKTVSGSFHDKKDFYEKLTKRGFVVRKVFEKRVFDWIEKNAKTTLEAYLMFSTAFSKWKGNNLLDSYYVKLLNDIPQLNREKIKGDPNSIGNPNQKEESALTETRASFEIEGIQNWPKHTVTVIPENDETNQLDIYDVKFNPSFKTLADDNAKLNNLTAYGNYIRKYLQSSPEFVMSLGKQITPVNRDTSFQFYDPTKDEKSPKYIPGSGRNPNRFNIKIDNEYLKNPDGSNFILPKGVAVNWYNALGYENHAIPEINPATLLLNKYEVSKQNTQTALLQNAADFEKSLEILNKDELDTDEIKKAFKNLIRSDIKYLVMSHNKNVPEDAYYKAKEFKNDLTRFVDKNITKDEKKALYKKYGAENQQQAINNLKKEEKDFYKSVENEIKIPDTIDNQIRWLKEYITNVETSDLSDNYTKKLRLDKLHKGLEILQYKKEHPDNLKPKNKLHTDYTHPKDIPSDLPKFDYISQPKGAKAKHTTTQADLGINQGIHSFGKESVWGNIINTLKENHIPVVDDQMPAKYVNYGASGTYADLPADGIISNPGSVFKTGGTFISEDQEADPQWDNRAHDTLNQDLFEGNHLRPEVREALLRIAGKFQNALGLNIDPVDVYFTGSGANFNYNELSDIDLHLVYDFEQIGINAEILIKYFIAKKQVFNNDYDITIKGMPVEVGVENLNEPIVSSAIYSVAKDQWMLEPKDAEHLLPKPDMKQYYEIVQRIEDAIESRNSKKIGDLWDELYRIRKDSLANDGEYGHGNGLFKKLRNLGYLDRLKHAYYSSASEELSLEALKEII